LSPQRSEHIQLAKAAIDGDFVSVERLITTRYIDVNTTVVSTLYGVVLVFDWKCSPVVVVVVVVVGSGSSSSEGCTQVVNVWYNGTRTRIRN